jgi:membrane-bound metal-dependent hydrolase YbcI (DUF457 family)
MSYRIHRILGLAVLVTGIPILDFLVLEPRFSLPVRVLVCAAIGFLFTRYILFKLLRVLQSPRVK